MARIRSTHPGQWTDDKFLSCSPLCRLLVLALRNEADDNGIFKWNLIEIKIRCLPLDNVDIQGLLDEAIENKQIRKFEVDNSEYGIIRNFQDWQKPKSPAFIYPIPSELEGLKPEGMGKGYKLNDKYMEKLRELNELDFGNSASEGEERREEKGRGGKKKGFTPPTEQEVVDYFLANGYSQAAATKAFRYYAENNWRDGKNNPVKNWKQKMIAVWFKDENKVNGGEKPETEFTKAQRIAKEKGYEKFKGHAHETPSQFIRRIHAAADPAAQH